MPVWVLTGLSLTSGRFVVAVFCWLAGVMAAVCDEAFGASRASSSRMRASSSSMRRSICRKASLFMSAADSVTPVATGVVGVCVASAADPSEDPVCAACVVVCAWAIVSV